MGTTANFGPFGCDWRYPKYASAGTDSSSLYQFLRRDMCTQVCFTQYRSKMTGLKRQQNNMIRSRLTPNGPNEITYAKVRYGVTPEGTMGSNFGSVTSMQYVDYMKVMFCHNVRNSPRDAKGVEMSNMKCRVKKAGGVFRVCATKMTGLKDQNWGFGKGRLPKGHVKFGIEYNLAQPLCCDIAKPCSAAFKEAYNSRSLGFYADPKTWSALDQHSLMAF